MGLVLHWRWWPRSAVAAALAGMLLGCGGGGGGGESAPTPVASALAGSSPEGFSGAASAAVPAASAAASVPAAPVVETPPATLPAKPASRTDAARFLTRATFGPTELDIDRLMAIGYAAWIDEQLALPAASHRANWEAADQALKAAQATAAAGHAQVLDSFWTQAVTGPDQLRQRVAFALSQIFVVSSLDSQVALNARASADWLDLLGREGLGNYRDLLQAVSLHPLMGAYLSSVHNEKANGSGHIPDENYAREMMQLFSIGLVELNEDGSPRGGETFGPTDVTGLARVFTGWSWTCPAWPHIYCFKYGYYGNQGADPDSWIKPMVAYPLFHSTEAKTFLGTTIEASTTSDAPGDLRTALDAVAAHPNVGPFIGRQLIQRLVSSNPSPAYVRAVARAFADNGNGRRGDMKAVVKAVLLHPEALQPTATAGKLREPVMRLSALLRAFAHRSDSGRWRVGFTDDDATMLGQTPLRAPSVFNFYRPGYVAPGSAAAAASLVAPEMQITHETSVAGYVNYMRDNLALGVGVHQATVDGVAYNRRDIQFDFTAEIALAERPAELADRVAVRLLGGPASAALKAEIVAAVQSVAVPSNASATAAQKEAARRLRVNLAVLLVVAAPEFLVQK